MRNDNANAIVGPIALLLIALGTITFQAIIFEEEYAQESFFPTAEIPNCDVYGDGIAEGIQRIGCQIGAFLTGVGNVFLVIYGVGVFLANAFTFNIPGAPWYIRVVFTTVFAGGIGIYLASLFRGTRA